MSVTTLKKSNKTINKNSSVTSKKKVKDHSNDPAVIKKAKAAETFIKKHGLPKGI